MTERFAESRLRSRWPAWKIVIAYVMLVTLAVLSVWFIDREVMRSSQATDHPAKPSSSR